MERGIYPLKKFKYLSLFSLLFVFILSGCNKRIDNYYMSLMGESESWRLTNYEIVLNEKDFKAGNGTLTYKNEQQTMTDWFEFSTHAVINNKDTVVHQNAVSGPSTELKEKSTGSIAGPTFIDENNKPITIDQVDSIYVVIKWKDENNKEVEERIDLESKENRGEAFLN